MEYFLLQIIIYLQVARELRKITILSVISIYIDLTKSFRQTFYYK